METYRTNQHEITDLDEKLQNPPEPPAKHELAERYEEMKQGRQRALDYAIANSELTLTELYAWIDKEELYEPYSELGGRGVQNLASKISSVTLPDEANFFSYEISDGFVEFLQAQIVEAQGALTAEDEEPTDLESEAAKDIQALEQKLVKQAKNVSKLIKQADDSSTFFSMCQHAQVAGSALMDKTLLGFSKVIPLNQFVWKLDSRNEIAEVIVEESLHYTELRKEERKKIPSTSKLIGNNKEFIKVYTQSVRRYEGDELVYDTTREVAGLKMETITTKTCPYIPYMFTPSGTNHYATAYVTSLFGTFSSLEKQEKNLEDASKILTDQKLRINPSTAITPDWLERQAEQGYISAEQGALEFIGPSFGSNLQLLTDDIQQKRLRIQQAFLLDSSVRRDAERVTATEINIVAQELQELIGAFFKTTSQKFQELYLRRVEELAVEAGEIELLNDEIFSRTLLRGVVDFTDSTEAQSYDRFMSRLLTVKPELANNLDGEQLARIIANQENIYVEDILLSPEEKLRSMGYAQLIPVLEELGDQGPGLLANLITQNLLQGDPTNA